MVTNSAVATDIDGRLRGLMPSIERECQGYAEVLTEVKWKLVEDAAHKKGLVVTSQDRDSLYRVESVQCTIVQRIQVLEMLKKSTPLEDWVKTGGDEFLANLRLKLSSIIGRRL